MKKMQKQPTTDPFTTAEKKQKRMRRFITAAVVLLVVSIACWGALPKNSSLESSDLFDAEEGKAKAEEGVQRLNAEDYDSLQEMTVEEVRSNMTKEKMDEAKEQIGSDWGEFQSLEEISTAEMHQRNVEAAVVQMVVAYENQDITYTLAFNTDMQLAAFGLQ